MKIIDEQRRVRKESVMFNTVKQQTPSTDNWDREDQTIVQPTRKKTANKILKTIKHFYHNNFWCNGLNSPLKRHRLIGWLLRVKGGKAIYQMNGSKNKLEFILRSNKVNFKPKLFRKYKESHYLLIKRIIHQEDKAMPGSAGALL